MILHNIATSQHKSEIDHFLLDAWIDETYLESLVVDYKSVWTAASRIIGDEDLPLITMNDANSVRCKTEKNNYIEQFIIHWPGGFGQKLPIWLFFCSSVISTLFHQDISFIALPLFELFVVPL